MIFLRAFQILLGFFTKLEFLERLSTEIREPRPLSNPVLLHICTVTPYLSKDPSLVHGNISNSLCLFIAGDLKNPYRRKEQTKLMEC